MKLVAKEVNYSEGGQNGLTALHYAAQAERDELGIVEALLPFVWDVDMCGTVWEVTPLHLACLHGNCNIARRLLRAGASPMKVVGQGMVSRWATRGEVGTRPIHLAARHGHLAVMRLLMNAGVPATLPDGDNCQPLHIVCRNAECSAAGTDATPFQPAAYDLQLHVESVKFLLSLPEVQKAVNVPDRRDATPLMMACQAGSTEIVELLLGTGNADARIKTPFVEQCCLHFAASSGSTAVAAFLAAQYPELCAWQDHLGNTPLHLAVKGGHHKTATALISAGSDPASPMNLLGETVEYLLSQRPGNRRTRKLEEEHDSGMVEAMRRGTVSHVKDLVSEAPDSNLLCKEAHTGNSLLHLACCRRTDSEGCAALLLSRDVSINAVNGSGRTALHLSILYRNTEAAKLLVDRGADLNIADKAWHGALHMAVGIGSLDMVKRLLQGGADVEGKAPTAGSRKHAGTLTGWTTPAHLAAASLYPEVNCPESGSCCGLECNDMITSYTHPAEHACSSPCVFVPLLVFQIAAAVAPHNIKAPAS